MDIRLLSLLLVSLCGWITCTNVDTTEAVWFRGDERSYFGYSVNLYRYRNKPSMRYVLIGAPRANGSVDVFQTGNTYRCEALNSSSCVELNLPGVAGPNAISDQGEASDEIEDKANMWMGGTVTSNYYTGTVVTSGHRYFSMDGDGSARHDPIGLTYILSDPESEGVQLRSCDGSSCSTRRSFYGICMSGFSTLILNDGSQLYVSATGYNYFRGTLFRGFEDTNCGDGIFREEVDFFGYMGYALTSGRILNSDEDTIVSSGPRQNSHLGNIFLISNDTSANLNTVLSLHGTTQDSYYGFSMLAIDLNRDGMDELLVSAPMFSLPGTPEIGQVLVYPNIGSGLGPATTVIQDIQQIPYSRFGTAIADLGDLNNDGYPEIAISAPYGNQAGSVFIYSGTPQGILSSQPIQTITGEEVGLERGAAFGASVSGKRDIDDNGYNDILIGAYVNSSAFLLRTLPVVTISITPSSNPVFAVISYEDARSEGLTANLTIDGNAESEYIFFTLILPISYTSQNSPDTIRISLTINSDPNFPTSRIFFANSTTSSRRYQDEFVLTRDFNTSVVILNPGLVPIFSVQPDVQCGNGSVCIPDLFITATPIFPVIMGSNPTVRYTEIIAGEVTEFSIDITVGNNRDDSYGTMMTLTIPPGTSFRIATIDSADLVIACQNPKTMNGFTSLTCSPLGRPLRKGRDIQFTVVLGVEVLNGDEGSLLVQMNLVNTNPDLNATLFDNSVNVSVNVTAVSDIGVGVEVRPDRLAFNETTDLRLQDLVDDSNNTFYTHSNLGPEIVYTITVRNLGPSPILTSNLLIRWPVGIRSTEDPEDNSLRDFFLYKTRINSANIQCDSSFVNLRNIQASIVIIDEGDNPVVGGRKRRRDVPLNDRTIPISEFKRHKRQTVVQAEPDFNTHIRFATDSQYYIVVLCSVGRISGGIEYELQITSRAFEPTLVMHAPLSEWTFGVNVTSSILDTHITQPAEHEADSAHVIVTLIPSSILAGSDEFTLWWVIAVAIVLFILLLFPIFLALYFFGFFKKNKTQKARDDQKRKLSEWNELQKGNTPNF
ncbi:Integrin alpha [Oopsacas minuta]|uniref:Integrin alpha n=1 Tax=Oopsacas minuta TaxID=111878 RepID=A0AAV7KD39_9METZ|nr:Integrin alpha [Oopsacas minuta]